MQKKIGQGISNNIKTKPSVVAFYQIAHIYVRKQYVNKLSCIFSRIF